MAGIVKHNWTAIFATLRADGWGPTSEGRTSLRKLADAVGVPAGTILTRVRSERARPNGGTLAAPVAPASIVVDPDADLPA